MNKRPVVVSVGRFGFFQVQVEEFALAPHRHQADDEGFSYGVVNGLGRVSVSWDEDSKGPYLKLQTGFGNVFYDLFQGPNHVSLRDDQEKPWTAESTLVASPDLELNWYEAFSVRTEFRVLPGPVDLPSPPPWLHDFRHLKERLDAADVPLWGHWLLPLADEATTPTWLLDRMVLTRWRPLLKRVAVNPSASSSALQFLSSVYPIHVTHNPGLALTLLTDPSIEEDFDERVRQWLAFQRTRGGW